MRERNLYTDDFSFKFGLVTQGKILCRHMAFGTGCLFLKLDDFLARSDASTVLVVCQLESL